MSTVNTDHGNRRIGAILLIGKEPTVGTAFGQGVLNITVYAYQHGGSFLGLGVNGGLTKAHQHRRAAIYAVYTAFNILYILQGNVVVVRSLGGIHRDHHGVGAHILD